MTNEEAVKILTEMPISTMSGKTFEEIANALELAIKALENERPHGEWILKETDCDDGGNNLYECTNCHHSDIHSGSIEVPYCWHCGADMREADNE